MHDLVTALREFNRERDWEQYHAPKNLAMALAAETGELLEPFLWLNVAESRKLEEQAVTLVREEIGDVLICLVNLADKLGIDPVQAAWEKLERNREKYPADKVRGKSAKYDQYPQKSKPQKSKQKRKP